MSSSTPGHPLDSARRAVGDPTSARILLVDDEQAILDLLTLVLQREGFSDIATATSSSAALHAIEGSPPALAVLDVMLPDGDGYALAGRIRQSSDAPIIFLTARGSDLDKLTGFGVGADDYVTKPFNPLEVVARIRAQLRRANGGSPPSDDTAAMVRDFGGFVLYETECRLVVRGRDVALPAREFHLLAFLSRHPGRVYSKRQIYRQVWGEDPLGEADDNTVQVHIRRLREKIEADPGSPHHLLTVRGLGYKLVKAAPGSASEDPAGTRPQDAC